MNNYLFLFLAILTACSGRQEAPSEMAATSNIPIRPNIILYLADDMGWGDSGCDQGRMMEHNKIITKGIYYLKQHTQ